MNDSPPQFHVATLMELPIPIRPDLSMTLLSSQPVPSRCESTRIAGATLRREGANVEVVIRTDVSCIIGDCLLY